MTLVERGGGARSFHIDSASLAEVVPIVRNNVRRESRLMTDAAIHYKGIGKDFVEHGRVEHRTRGRKRSRRHPYEHGRRLLTRSQARHEGHLPALFRKALHRYLSEFDFRYSNRIALGVNDEARANRALKGVVGKRLTYRQPDVTAAE